MTGRNLLKLNVSSLMGWISLAVPFMAQAESVESPPLKAGDSWVYQYTVETGSSGWTKTRNELAVNRVTAANLYLSTKQSGSTQNVREFVIGADWGRLRAVNGKETVVARPLKFPMTIGQSWELQYTEQKPPNSRNKYETHNTKYVVVGREDVEVPAGKFSALKIEAEGTWQAEAEPVSRVVQGAESTQGNTTMISQVQNSAGMVSTGRTYKAYWYVPEVRRWVKSVEEYYTSNGTRNERYAEELESYKLKD
ncbi:hypothetical protein [Sphaerotilus sp.]|jgi:hypothetical protein|uniref:hypothetical protein n=1 Tax=Sphaerotilus sp. TaxID=2093942 RepID=UPI0025CDB6B6|nr:hypothetical protein [Sphaerotilus sp.]